MVPRRLEVGKRPDASLESHSGKRSSCSEMNQAPKEGGTSSFTQRYRLPEAIPFALAHLACLGAIWTGVYWGDILIAVGLYALRIFAIGAGYHRFFSHRGFRTSRAFAFVLAFLAQTSAQRGVLWWAGTHRHHHRFSDQDDDVHSPVRHGFWHSHLGWIFTARYHATNFDAVPDLAKYPELRWLDRNHYIPPVALGFLVWLLAGWSGLVVGFFWSTVAVWHATFSINSLAHVVGRPRYVTGDQSRNNWWLALLTFGEGWHNNHHHYQASVRQGFRWYEVDLTYYLLRGLSAIGLVWDLRYPPEEVVRSEQKLGRAVIERAAGQLAASFQVDRIVADFSAALAEQRARLDTSIDGLHDELAERLDRWHRQLDERVESARSELEQLIHKAHMPHMPTMAELQARAADMFVRSPSMNEIVERARQILYDELCDALLVREPAVSTLPRK